MGAYIFDTETTGLSEPQVIEAAWVRVAWPVIFEQEYVERFCPSKPSELGALATHHILDSELSGCRPSVDFQLPADTEYLVGHNVDFDWKVVGGGEMRRICTKALSQYLWPELDSHRQSSMIYHLFPHAEARDLLQKAHSALADVQNCARLLQKIIVKSGAQGWEELWQLSEKARIPLRMPFGKHKGALMADVPLDYKKWYARQAETDPYIMAAFFPPKAAL